MKILIACEESQTVCKAFRNRGFEAYSCDIQEPSGGYPEWHIMGDVLPLLRGDCVITTMDGNRHHVTTWDLMIAHPPCTYLTVTGNRWFNVERYGDKALKRMEDRKDAIDFFMQFTVANARYIAIENPIGCMSTAYRKPDQIIQPYEYGHPTTKKTCLWLEGLPQLIPTNVVAVDPSDVYSYVAKDGKVKHDSRHRSKCSKAERGKHRSKTFPGIATAMAEQWGAFIKESALMLEEV